MISYAQNYEDVILARAFADVAEGFFVDVGAASPNEATVTRHFYERGWHGVNIEPLPHWAAQLRSVRLRDLNLQVAAGSKHGEMTLYRVVDDLSLSTLSEDLAARYRAKHMELEPVPVQVVTLNEVLAEIQPPQIDFLKVDVEGAEPEVLRGIDLGRWRPRVIMVEATEPYSLTPTHQHFEPMLLAANYRYASTDGINRYYVAEEAQALAPLLVPANSLDDFTPMREQLLIDEIARLRRYVRQHERSDRSPAASAEAGDEPDRHDFAAAEAAEPGGRFAIVASPQCGTGRLAVLLAAALSAPEAVVSHPADVAWEELPNAGVLRMIWPRTERASALLVRHGFQLVTVARHPLETLLAICRLVQVDRTTLEWLAGDLGSEDALVGADPTSDAFVSWATSARAQALVGVTSSWWSDPTVTRFRHEELLQDPNRELARVVELAGQSASAMSRLGDVLRNVADLEEIPGSWSRYLTPEIGLALRDAHRTSFEVQGYDLEFDIEQLPNAEEARHNWAVLCGYVEAD